jgi:hypothetical protein
MAQDMKSRPCLLENYLIKSLGCTGVWRTYGSYTDANVSTKNRRHDILVTLRPDLGLNSDLLN